MKGFELIQEFEDACLQIATVRAALILDVFSFFSAGTRRLEEYVGATGHDLRGSGVLLNSLASLNLLESSSAGYSLTTVSRAFLLPESPYYYGKTCLEITLAFPVVEGLAEAVRTGRPTGLGSRVTPTGVLWASDFAPSLVLWPHIAERARRMWRTVLQRNVGSEPLNLLDIACGPGVKAFALLQDYPRAHCKSIDLHPEVLAIAQQIAIEMGVSDRVSIQKADLLDADFGSNQYDIVHIGSVLYFFSSSQLAGLLHRVRHGLRPGGRIVINHALASESSRSSLRTSLLAVQLLLFHGNSEVHSFTTYQRLLSAAGFEDVIEVPVVDAATDSVDIIVTGVISSVGTMNR